MEFNDILKLAKTVAKADPSKPVAYSFGDKTYGYDEMNEALREEFKALAKDFRTYQINQNTIFALIEQTIDDVLPQRLELNYGAFCEIKTFAQGERPIFIEKGINRASKERAKQFIGKVGLNGLYEVFKLDGRKSYEVATNAIGGAAAIGFEEFLDGRVNFADVLDILMEGLDQCIYQEVQAQLIDAVDNIIPANKLASNTFDADKMDKLLSIADSYGKSTIYCTFEFAAQMIPSDYHWASDAMKQKIWDNGYLGSYKTHNVIVLPQLWETEAHLQKVIDPSYAWIIPTGAAKPVKIAFEGGAIAQEVTNYDQSREVHVYKKVGVRAIFSNSICVYQNTSLKRAL